MNTNCEQVLNYCCSSSRGKNTIGNSTLNAISSIVFVGAWVISFLRASDFMHNARFETILRVQCGTHCGPLLIFMSICWLMVESVHVAFGGGKSFIEELRNFLQENMQNPRISKDAFLVYLTTFTSLLLI
jgi:hypothetical protein